MIRFEEDSRGVVLEYEAELNDPEWVLKRLEQDGEVTVSSAFTFETGDLLEPSSTRRVINSHEGAFRFRFAAKKAGYYRIPARVLGCNRDVLITIQGMRLQRKTFVAERNIGIFPRIEKVMTAQGEIVVGGARQDSISVEVFSRPSGQIPYLYRT